jgi:2-polyprenyl-6-methoxyphenol hydroxylase-like FAD-dependent oxidoreductase
MGSHNQSVIIIGASLAGLMTAIAFARAGFSVTILEKGDSYPRQGAVLQVDQGQIDRTETALHLRRIASGGLRSAESWASIYANLRSETALYVNIERHYNTAVESVGQDEKSAWAFTRNGEVFHADILIGADGLHSIVRPLVAPRHPHAVYAGYMIWVSVIDEINLPPKSRPSLHHPSVSMPNGKDDFLLGAIVAGDDGLRSLGNRKLGWAWYDKTQNDLLRQIGCVSGNRVIHSLRGDDIPKQTLASLSQKAHERWPQPWLDSTLFSIETRNLTGLPIAEYLPETLANGRIAVVGDAAHLSSPITAAGFNASLEDASTLIECCVPGLRKNDPIAALKDYEARRLSQVKRIVRSGQEFSKSFAP